MAILRLFKKETGMTYIVEEGTILHEVLISEGFSLVSAPKEDQTQPGESETQGKLKEIISGHIEDGEELFAGDKDIAKMSKIELIELAELMGIQIAKKENMESIISKIKQAKEGE